MRTSITGAIRSVRLLILWGTGEFVFEVAVVFFFCCLGVWLPVVEQVFCFSEFTSSSHSRYSADDDEKQRREHGENGEKDGIHATLLCGTLEKPERLTKPWSAPTFPDLRGVRTQSQAFINVEVDRTANTLQPIEYSGNLDVTVLGADTPSSSSCVSHRKAGTVVSLERCR